MGKTFAKVYASSAGSFDNNTSKIPQWITANGGTFTKEITEGVTHIIASEDAYKQNVPAAESLLQASRTPKHVKDYLWVNILKDRKKQTQTRKETFDKNKGKGKAATDCGDTQAEGGEAEAGQPIAGPRKRGRPPQDKTGKTKSGKKRRKQRVKSSDPFDSKHRTSKAESIAADHRLYEAESVTFSATLVRQSIIARYHKETVLLRVRTHENRISAPLGSDLETAMAAFREFFKGQTGKGWEDRLNGVSPPPKTDRNGNSLPVHKGWFWYDNHSPVTSLARLFRDGEI
ncbi:BRCT domain protein [Aspergillus stella-maris]|uniref:BRCT domain protein n=1 Tax=Aspergillus stella-maris TaxID=1810926 RepID=UPI003CCD7086